ncbi:ATP-grasp domain-containing protein [Haladaptatus sp. DFWS20]|uniref:ATP-grasp domain-containing protein n=1 Tax=Haladaptatus sp. DFWS20 TaxID=3403467 RepID=UPI003EB7A7CA
MTVSSDDSVRVGVLSFHNSKETKAILNAVEGLGHTPVWFRKANTRIRIIGDQPSLVPDADVLVNRLLLATIDDPLEELEIANVLAGIRPMVNHPRDVLTAIHKYATAVHLSNHGVRTPDSYFALSGHSFADGRDHIGSQMVLKTGIGTHGETAWKLHETERPSHLVGRRHTFLQRFLRQDDRQWDVRAYVVGDDVVGMMRRSAPNGDWRTNVARGGVPENATDELPNEVRAIARKAAHVVGLDIAGVDLMEWNGDWYVLEVNPTAGFTGLYHATGTSAAPFIARLAIERAGGTVSDERVKVLAETLDDSVPGCKPARAQANPGSGPLTVGYTERVLVNGLLGIESAVAKADTGAKRTSIGIDLAAKVGAGPIKSSTTVRSGSRRSNKKRPLVDVDIVLGDNWHRTTASVVDRSHMRYQLIIGRDVLANYPVDLKRRAEED